jgi:hypothetical protein
MAAILARLAIVNLNKTELSAKLADHAAELEIPVTEEYMSALLWPDWCN